MPSNWTVVKLADIAMIQGGGTPSRTEPAYFGGELPWVTPTDLEPIGNITLLDAVAETITIRGLQNSSAKVIPAGSVLFSSRASIGKIAVTDRDCATNQGFINLTPKADRVCPWFLAYLLAHHRTDLIQLAGKTTFLEIPRGKFKDFEIAIPPVSEQYRIVSRIKECLEKVEEIEGLAKILRHESNHLPQAFRFDLWEECVTSYPMIKLGSIVTSAKNGLYKPREYHGSGTLLLRMFNINGADFDDARLERLQVTSKEAEDYSILNGDIIISRVNSRELVGKSAVVAGLMESAVFEAMLIRLRINAKLVRQDVLAWLMNSPQFLHDLRMRAKHAIGQSSINQQDLLESLLPLPPLTEQEKTAEKFSGLGGGAAMLKEECATQSQATEGLREAILRKAFAGEL
ncbi:restriction endonuclease subunit S [Geomonas sp. Red69]|uniref:restriction endonuclease subunit S n=1 Tax=Geomonas diazotrophica TaxID=2843197 RepID=UPI001C11F566|nr:restriction endonuclease subunit S [Geomonas diazotrophica]MBU5637504.1 restriction endonuclease subunit S [Geomonas diazotrophica]